MAEYSKLGGGKAWLNWLLGVGFVLFVFTFQTGYAITNIEVTRDLGLTVAQVALVGSLYTWAFAFAQFSSGAILDRLGMRWVLPIACSVVTTGGFVFANATGIEMLILGQILMALGASFGFVGAGFVGGQWFGPVKFGIMFCWVQFMASMGAITGQNVIRMMIENEMVWSQILNTMATIGLVISVLMFIFMRDPVVEGKERAPWPGVKTFLKDLIASIRQVASIRDSWFNALIGGATFGSMLALGVLWGPRFLQAGGMEASDAFAASAMMWLGVACGAPFWGWLSEKLRKRKLPMAAGCALQMLTIIVIISQPGMSFNAAAVCFVIWGVMAGASMLNYPIGADLVPDRFIGTSAAVVNAVQFITAGIIMAIPGRILSGSGFLAGIAGVEEGVELTIAAYQASMMVLPVALGIGLLLFLFLRETHPESAGTKSDVRLAAGQA